MGTERKALSNFGDWRNNTERRLNQQERRPQIYSASDLLGPGFGPTATQILDWSSDDAVFNGFFWSPVGAQNSPDSTEEWVGIVVAEDDSMYGIQHVWTPRSGDPPRAYVRRWSDPGGGGTRSYTQWRGDRTWSSTGITAEGGSTITSQGWTKSNRVCNVTAVLQVGSNITVGTNGNVTNTALALLPAVLWPTAQPISQGLGSGGSGRMCSWIVNTSGEVLLTATTSGSDILAGDTISFSGTFLL